MKGLLSFATLSTFLLAANAASLPLIKSYAGSTFFDDWIFYGDTDAGLRGPWNGTTPWDDLTNGASELSPTGIDRNGIYRGRVLYGPSQRIQPIPFR